MADNNYDPFINFRYVVEIDGIKSMGFSKISELSNETSVFKYKEGGMNSSEHKLPQTTEYSNIVLEHGLSLDNTLYEWRQNVIDGHIDDALKNGYIEVYTKNSLSSIWYFYGAWPSKMTISSLDASASGSGEVIVESVELVVDRFERFNIDEL